MTDAASEPDSLPGNQKFDEQVADSSPTGWSPNRSRRNIIIGSALILGGVAIALFAWGLPPFNSGSVTTNNAYVRGRTIVVSPQVGGYLVDVPVVDFQQVRKGDLLARIDDRPFREKLLQGEATTAAQNANLANSQQSLRSAQAQRDLQDASVASAQAALQKAQADMNRITELVGEGSVSLRDRDQARAVLQQAQAGVRQAQAQRAIANEQIRSVQVGRGALEAQVKGANATKGLALLELSRTEVRAPRDGQLSEVAAREGHLVNAGTQLMFIVPDELWVIANFKEAQTSQMKVGQRATLEIDALGGAKLEGKVQSIAPAAGSEFSVIKPDTGAGNFVKVPQRIAVRIIFNRGQKLARRLGPGMSVVATVHAGE